MSHYTAYYETKVAGQDLSDSWGRFCTINSAGVAVIASSGSGIDARGWGVVDNTAQSGQAVSLCVLGAHRLIAGAAIRHTSLLTTNSLGAAVPAASGDWVSAESIYTAAAGDVFDALVCRPWRLVG
jgi:hypothetical protein